MNALLLRSCACTWLVGLGGMCITKVVLALDASALPFQVAARLWLVGGLGYAGLGLLGLVSRTPRARRARAPSSADLSALIHGR
jgi:hypothetical protein